MRVLLLSVAITALAIASVAAQKAPAKPQKSAKPATYAGEVATILNRSCVSCHRPGQVAPFSLVGYDNAKKWAPMIAAVTQSRRMPPWKATEGYGSFHDENRLSAEEISLLQRWYKAGMPRGDSSKEPPAPKFSSEWALGTPDLVLSTKQPFKLEAEGEDVYRNFVIKTDYKEPVYVTAMEVRPGNPKVVHHVIAFLDNRGTSHRLEERSNDGQEGYTSSGGGVGFLPSGALGGWAPGVRPRHSQPGTGFKIEPGATIVMQVHYHKSGKPEVDQTKLGLYFSKIPVSKEVQLLWALKPTLRIPAGAEAYRETLTVPIPVDATLYGVMPHMHLLGRSMKAYVETKEGKTIPLIEVKDWDFNWQLNYVLKEPLKVPAGSRIQIEAVYDNSKNNPRQPNDPPKQVTWGEGTTDEMFLLVCAYAR